MKKVLLLLAAPLIFHSAYAQEPREGVTDEVDLPQPLRLTLVNPRFCQTWETDLYGRARHSRSSGPSFLQEHNWGVMFGCETKSRTLSRFPWVRISYKLFGGGLRNSQNGTATVFGATYDARVLAIPGWHRVESAGLHLGVSPTYLEYEKRNGSVVRGVLPIPHLAAGLRFYASGGRVLEVKLVQQYLGKGVILRHLTIQRDV